MPNCIDPLCYRNVQHPRIQTLNPLKYVNLHGNQYSIYLKKTNSWSICSCFQCQTLNTAIPQKLMGGSTDHGHQ